MQIIRASESGESAVGFMIAAVIVLVVLPAVITKYENIFEFNEKRFEHDDEKDRYEDEFDDDFDLEDYLNSRGLKLKK